MGAKTIRHDVERTKGVLEKLRRRFNAERGFGRFVTHAKVNFVDNHLMTADIRHGQFRIIADEPGAAGGLDLAPTPLEYFVAGFALCESAQYMWQIADMDLDIEHISLEVKTRNAWTPVFPEGTDETPELSRIDLVVRITSSEPRERIEELIARAARHCPAHNSLVQPLTVNTVLELNGDDPGDDDPSVFEALIAR